MAEASRISTGQLIAHSALRRWERLCGHMHLVMTTTVPMSSATESDKATATPEAMGVADAAMADALVGVTEGMLTVTVTITVTEHWDQQHGHL